MKLKDLFEAEDPGNPLKIAPLDSVDEAIRVIKTRCAGSAWMTEEDTPFYKGVKSGQLNLGPFGCAVIDTTKSKRVSENTTNWYTNFLDSNPKNADWPKRSRSLVCSSSKKYAATFASTAKDNLVLIPFDTAAVGVVNAADLWRVKIPEFKNLTIDQVNEFFDELDEDGEGLEAVDYYAKRMAMNPESTAAASFRRAARFYIAEKDLDRAVSNLKGFLQDVYSMEHLGFSKFLGAQSKAGFVKSSEAWIEGKVLAMTLDIWQELVVAK